MLLLLRASCGLGAIQQGSLASSCIRALVQFRRCGMCREVWSEGSVMSGSTTMTIRVTSALKARLGRLAQDTQQSPSDLAAMAVSGYVDRELAVVAGIRRGLDDVEAGRVIGHDDAMRALHAAIDKVGDNVGDKAGG